MSAPLELVDHVVAERLRFEADDVDEPAHARRPGRRLMERDAVDRRRAGRGTSARRGRVRPASRRCAAICDSAERGAQLVEAVVEAEARVREPAVEDVAPLVAEAAEERVPRVSSVTIMPPSPVVICLFGIEGEDGGVRRACRSGGPCTRAPIASQASSITARSVRVGEGEDRVHVRRLTEDVHREDGLQPLAAAGEPGGRPDQGVRVEGERHRIDVDEHRARADVEDAVRRGDEAEGRRRPRRRPRRRRRRAAQRCSAAVPLLTPTPWRAPT